MWTLTQKPNKAFHRLLAFLPLHRHRETPSVGLWVPADSGMDSIQKAPAQVTGHGSGSSGPILEAPVLPPELGSLMCRDRWLKSAMGPGCC